MHSSIITSSIVGLLTFTNAAYATTYAQFCDDTDCSQNCGESVSVNNPGCLKEANRHWIKFHGTNAQQASLVLSPGDDCACQNECINEIVAGSTVINVGPGCYSLSGHSGAYSFRFIGGGCTIDNCWTTGASGGMVLNRVAGVSITNVIGASCFYLSSTIHRLAPAQKHESQTLFT